MPNWCNNYLKITADPGLLNKLLDLPKDAFRHAFSFEPFHEKISNLCDEDYIKWLVDNTGSKWWPIIESSNMEVGLGYIYLNYHTAWSPNERSIYALANWLSFQSEESREDWAIDFIYNEPSMGFCGGLMLKSSRTTYDRYHEILNFNSDYKELEWDTWLAKTPSEQALLTQGIMHMTEYDSVQKLMNSEEYFIIAPLNYAELFNEMMRS